MTARLPLRRSLCTSLALAALAAMSVACADDPVDVDVHAAVDARRSSTTTQALFTNGDFESDAIGATPPTGFSLQTFLNGGVTGTASTPPSSVTSLNLGTAGAGKIETFVVGGTNRTQTDPDLGAGQNFRFPLFGERAARVNFKDATDSGKNKNANLITQTMTVGASDIDAVDGLAHVRFAIAPVLENPAHAYNQQPYFYVELTNVTRGTSLFHVFNTAGQAGVPWQTTVSTRTGNATLWTDWQLVDIAPGNDKLATGDQVKLTVVASGCSLGGHFGRVYVDGLGGSIPSVFTAATADKPSVNPGDTLTYTHRVTNGASTPTVGTTFTFTTPPQTTFASITPPSGVTCTSPSAGSAGNVTCSLGTMPVGLTQNIVIAVTVGASATGTITHGTYAVSAANAPTLTGATLTTPVITPPDANTTSDISVSVTDSRQALVWGATQATNPTGPTYVVAVTNPKGTVSSAGASATVTTTFSLSPSSNATIASWCRLQSDGTGGNANTCSGSTGNSCSSNCGTSFTHTVNFNAGGTRVGSRRYKVVVDVAADPVPGTANTTGTLTATATSAAATGFTDPTSTNNTATDFDTIGESISTLNVSKSGTGTGTVLSSLPAINCGATCSYDYGTGTSLTLTATPASGSTFSTWGGGASSCGSATTCTLNVIGTGTPKALAVSATFSTQPPAVATQMFLLSGDVQAASTGSAFAPLRVIVTDNNFTPVSGTSVTFTTTPAGGGASTTTTTSSATTDASGIASVTRTANGTAGSYTVTATATSLPSVTFHLTNVGPASKMVYVTGGNATDPNQTPVSSAFPAPLTVLVTDAADNPVAGVVVRFAVPGSGASATLSSTTATSDASGLASVSATANATAGAFVATATSTGLSSVTFQLENQVAGPASIFVVSGTPQAQPASPNTTYLEPLVVVVADAGGNAVPGVTVTFTRPSSGASAGLLKGTNANTATATTNALGLASITAASGSTIGSYDVTASVVGVTGTAVFRLTNLGANVLRIVSGDAQSAAVTANFGAALVVELVDGAGTPVSGTTITFSAPATGARATFPTSQTSTTASTSALGIATSSLPRAGSVVGSYSVTAQATNVAPVTFTLTNLPGTATAIAAFSGTPQSATTSSDFAAPIVAKVTDAGNNPVEGATVTFAAPGSGASAVLAFSSATTDAQGLAATTVTANATGGTYNVTASTTGVVGSASFALTNTVDLCAGVVCTASDQCHDAGTCNPADGTCSNPTKSDGATCSDGNACTQSDTCQAGACTGASPVVCTASDQCHDAGTCNPSTGVCSDPAKADGVACNDGDACTQTDTCQTGACAGGNPVVCTASDQCHDAGACNPADGTCSNPTKSDGATCSDGNACTQSDTCQAGACAGADPVVCTASDQCHDAGTCDALTGACSNPAKADGATCSDGSACTQSDTCQAGACAGGNPVVCTASDQCHDVGTCDALTGVCGTPAKADGVTCNDGNVGTGNDVCAAGVCNGVTPTAIVVIGGGAQRAIVDTDFADALVVEVRDAFGGALAGIDVTFTAPLSRASSTLSATTVATDAQGRASVVAHANASLGAYDVTASVGGGVDAVFSLENITSPATTLVLVSGTPQTVAVDDDFADLVVRVQDDLGHAVAGVAVAFDAPPAGASAALGAALATSDADGLAHVTAHAGTVVGSFVVTATLAGTAARADFALATVAGPVDHVVLEPSSSSMATLVGTAFAAPLSLVAFDAFDNPVPHATITFVPPAAEPTAQPSSTTAVTDASGGVSVDVTAGLVVGSYDVGVRADPATAGPSTTLASFHLQNLPGPAVNLAIVSGTPGHTVVDTAFAAPLVVRVTDAHGNAVAGVEVRFTAPATSPTALFDTPTALTNAQGEAQIAARADTKAGSYTVTASTTGAAQTVSFALTNDPGTAAALSIRPGGTPQSATVGTRYAATLDVVVVDAFGNPVPGVVVHYVVVDGEATVLLDADSDTTGDDGAASVGAVAGDVPGDVSVAASVDGVDELVHFALANLVGAPARLALVGGDRQSARVSAEFALPLEVRLTDDLGNAIVGATIAFAVSDGVALDVSSPVTTDFRGHAQTTVTAGHDVGDAHVIATADNIATGVVFALAVEAGDAANLIASPTSTPQSTRVSTPFARALVATVVDGFGNPLRGVPVVFSAPADGASAALSATTVVSDDAGNVAVFATAGAVAGAYDVTARIDDGATPLAVAPARFALANTVQVPSTLTLVSGGGQSAPARSAFAAPLVFAVVDDAGVAVAGVDVTFAVVAGGVSLGSTTSTTDVDGLASTTLVAGAVTGRATIVASAPGVATPVAANVDVTALPTTTTLSTPADSALGDPVLLTASVTSSAGVPAGSVCFAVDGGACHDVVVDDAGGATFTLTGLVAGEHVLTATFAPDEPWAASAATPTTVTVVDGAVLVGGGGCGCTQGPLDVSAPFATAVLLLLRRRRRAG